MSKKNYPVLGRVGRSKGWIQHPKGAPVCDAEGCGKKATHRVDIEVNWFRGDDLCARACDVHKGDIGPLVVGADKREAEKEARRDAAQQAKAS